MRTDTLFHEYFQLAPQALFELWQIEPGCAYHVTSPVVKSSERRLDALFEPESPDEPRYFVEVQGYEDATIYWRMLQQVALYHAQRPELNGQTWLAVVLHLEAGQDLGVNTLGPLGHGTGSWLRRGVLPELLAAARSPLLNVLRPLAAPETEVRQHAADWHRELIEALAPDNASQAHLLELFVQCIIQRFRNMTRQEIEAMVHLTPIEETVVGQELIQQGLQQGLQQGALQTIRGDVLDVLEVRFGAAPEPVRNAISGINDRDALKALHRLAVQADSIAAFERALERRDVAD